MYIGFFQSYINLRKLRVEEESPQEQGSHNYFKKRCLRRLEALAEGVKNREKKKKTKWDSPHWLLPYGTGTVEERLVPWVSSSHSTITHHSEPSGRLAMFLPDSGSSCVMWSKEGSTLGAINETSSGHNTA